MVEDNAPAPEASASSHGLINHGILSAPHSIQDCVFNPHVSEFNLSSSTENLEFNLGLCVQSAHFGVQSEFNPTSILENCDS